MESDFSEIDWDLLLEDIRNQECVIVLGPEIINYGESPSFFAAVSNELKQNRYVTKVFEDEELFKIRISNTTRIEAELNDGKRQIIKALRNVIAQHESSLREVSSLLKKLPLHLIISLYPEENVIKDALEGNEGKSVTYYQKNKTSEKEKFDEPSTQKPVVYNLLGALSDIESLVLTYDDLMDYVFSILGVNRLPENLSNTLLRTRRFIFLGAHFNKWYMQLLFKLLAKDKIAYAISNDLNESSKTFVFDRLSLDVMSYTPVNFLRKVTEQYEKEMANGTPATITRTETIQKDSPVTVFFSYSHADEDYKTEVLSALNLLITRQKKIVVWDDRQIVASQDWNNEIVEKLNQAELVICLVSRQFLNSKYCVDEEVAAAINQQKYILPIIIKPCAWLDYDFFRDRQAIPRDNKTLSGAADQELAYLEVLNEVKGLVDLIIRER